MITFFYVLEMSKWRYFALEKVKFSDPKFYQPI